VSAAARLYARLEPIAYDDDGTLQDLTTALMAPVEIAEIARDTDTLVAWEALWDPDECPAELLDWLAIANGVILPPSALTTAEKRYRIKQAAGRYRGTPRALVEEIQLVLTGTKTVYMAFKTADRWTTPSPRSTRRRPTKTRSRRQSSARTPRSCCGNGCSRRTGHGWCSRPR
jgi:phage tail P2-like protein